MVADFWTAEFRIAAAIAAMAKEAQHAARKLRIVTLQIAKVPGYGPRNDALLPQLRVLRSNDANVGVRFTSNPRK
jgi:hypothetical protein